jgi:hypothetical protein
MDEPIDPMDGKCCVYGTQPKMDEPIDPIIHDFLLPCGVLSSGQIPRLCLICSGKDVYVIHIVGKMEAYCLIAN